MSFCLTDEARKKLLDSIKSGSLDIIKLTTKSSEDARKEFAKIVGDGSAKELNLLFEKKLLLKNTEKGLINFIKESTGLNAQEKAKHTIKVQEELQRKKNRLYNPAEKEKVLQEILNNIEDKRIVKEKSKLSNRYFKGQNSVSLEEMKNITELSKKAISLKEKVNVDSLDSQVAYGESLIDLDEYVSTLTTGKSSLKDNILNGLGLLRIAKIGLDLATPFVQGKKSIGTKEWRKAFVQQFASAVSKSKSRTFKAAILGDPDYELIKSTTLRMSSLTHNLKGKEEQFMTDWASKIPVVAGLARSAEDFSTGLRFYTAKNLIANAKQAGMDISKGSETLEGIAHAINIVTRSANFGKNDKFGSLAPLANNVMWSSRGVYATGQMWNPVQYAKLPPIARNYMFKRLIAAGSMTMGLVGLAVLKGDDVELDPSSSKFLQIPIGNNSYFDPTFGDKSYINFMARMINRKYKASSGITYNIDDPNSPVNVDSTTIDFFRNKLANTAAFVANNIWWREDTLGRKQSIPQQLLNVVNPMGIENAIQLGTDMGVGAPSLFWSIIGLGGFNTQTYSTSTDWSQSDGVELQQFNDKVGDTKFKEANDLYNKTTEKLIKQAQSNPSYKSLSEESKANVLSGIKDKVKSDVFKKYGFRYKEGKQTQQEKMESNKVKGLIKSTY